MKTAVIGLSNGKWFAHRLAAHLGKKTSPYSFRKFPDGELYIKFDSSLRGKKVILVQSLCCAKNSSPNDAILELVFAARTAKKLGAKKVVAVVPYLAYMRQDKAFNFGESFSAKEMAWLLSQCIDALFSFDPHLHRISSLSKIFSVPAKKLSADKKIAEFVAQRFSKENTVVVGPDFESSQWAKKIADSIGFWSSILQKRRFGDRKVEVKVVKELEWENKNIVIIDDIISTGNTIVQAILELKKRKPRAVYCICVHPILAEGALSKILKAGAKEVISCNSIESKTNRIDLSGEVAKFLM